LVPLSNPTLGKDKDPKECALDYYREAFALLNKALYGKWDVRYLFKKIPYFL
jgi:hypothetical protein